MMDLNRVDRVPYCMDVFQNMVDNDPDTVILVDHLHPCGWTRAEVDDLSGRVYRYLRKQGIGREDFVLIRMPRGGLPIIAMIGVWKAGAALTVVEYDYAPDRIEFIREDCGCKLVIDPDVWKEIVSEEPLPGYTKADLHDAAFAVYTSGSSGTPKGVLHEYGNMKMDHLSAEAEESEEESGKTWRVALVAPLNFIAATMTTIDLLYSPFLLHIIPYSISKNPLKLQRYYTEHGINYSFLSPSLIRALKENISPSLELIFTGSEPAGNVFVEGAALVNTYSMSEAAFTLCQFEIDHPYDVCPVGRPNSDLIQIHLLDEEGREVPKGETGEVCFEAPFFRGYIHLPEETKRAFRDGLFRSGDLARQNENGDYVLLGRANDMFKINGNRIEPAEIEAAFKKLTGVSWCAARGFEKPEDSFICLYYQEKSFSMTDRELREGMSASLPYYMIPAHFIRIDEIPLLPNGKLNRRALPEPQITEQRAEYIAPRTELEARLCKVFGEVLHRDRVGVTESFYDLGGSSLSAMEVLALMDLDDLSAIDIFQGRTPEGVAQLYEDRRKESFDEDPETVELRERARPQLPTANQVNLIDYTLYNPGKLPLNLPLLFSFPKETDAGRLCRAFQDVIKAHPVFSTVFEFDENCELVERYVPEKCPVIQITELTEEEFQVRKDSLVQVFRMLGEPLARGGIYQTEEKIYLFLDMHHAVTDGSSYQIFLRDLARAYKGEALELDTYYTYLARENRLRECDKYENARRYYREAYEKESWCGNLRPDVKARPTGFDFLQLPSVLSQEQMEAFERRSGSSRNTFAAAVCLLTIAKVEHENHVMFNWVFHDRTDRIKQNAFGCLYRNIPVGIRLEKLSTLGDLLEEIQAQSAASITHSCYEWSVLNDHIYINDLMMLVYETTAIMSDDELDDLSAKSEVIDPHRNANIRSLAVQIIDMPEAIVTMMAFTASIYSPEKRKLAAETMDRVIQWIAEAEDPSSISLKEILA